MAWLIIVGLGAAVFFYLMFPLPEGNKIEIAAFSLAGAAIAVGSPAIVGILIVQAPSLAWAKLKEWPRPLTWAVPAIANVIFTLAVFAIFTSGAVLRSAFAMTLLAALAVAAALVWVWFDNVFDRKDADA